MLAEVEQVAKKEVERYSLCDQFNFSSITMSKGDKYVCTLSPELLERAKKELNEDPNTRHLEIKAVRERLEKVAGKILRLR